MGPYRFDIKQTDSGWEAEIYYNGKLTHTCKLRSQAVEIAIANYGHKLVFPS